MHKLLLAVINGKMYFAIKNIYTMTLACVKLNSNMKSSWFHTLFGVRQGDSMSPSLFSVFLIDLAKEIQEMNCGVEVNGRNFGILLYADDIALMSTTEENLQKMLNVLSNWSSKWCIYVNEKKSKIVHFRKNLVNRSSFHFKCGESTLNYVTSYKYLGVTINEFLSYDDNANILAQSAGRALGGIIAKYKMHKNTWATLGLQNCTTHVYVL